MIATHPTIRIIRLKKTKSPIVLAAGNGDPKYDISRMKTASVKQKKKSDFIIIAIRNMEP